MDIESFLQNTPAGEPINNLITYKIASQADQGHFLSPMAALAELYIEAGQRKLKERPLQPLTKMVNHGAIIFGSTLRAIENMLVNRTYHPDDFNIPYYRGIEHPIPTVTNPLGPGITFETWQQMIALAKEDNSFGKFFEESGLNLLPKQLKTVLQNQAGQFLSQMQRDFLPPHRRFVASLEFPKAQVEISEDQPQTA
ncbi:MAG: hypothetical protein Q7R49_07300 [Candidatus Daviesbacteria bacterium]|nr:hypothetical protein [Candidatus Daviesbacteria bacterium]